MFVKFYRQAREGNEGKGLKHFHEVQHHLTAFSDLKFQRSFPQGHLEMFYDKEIGLTN